MLLVSAPGGACYLSVLGSWYSPTPVLVEIIDSEAYSWFASVPGLDWLPGLDLLLASAPGGACLLRASLS